MDQILFVLLMYSMVFKFVSLSVKQGFQPNHPGRRAICNVDDAFLIFVHNIFIIDAR